MKKIDQQIQKARHAVSQERFELALNILSQALSDEPENFACLIMRGELFLRSGDYQNALQDYAKAVEIDNSNVIALNNFGASLIRCNQRAEAQQVFEYLLELQPDNFDALINLGATYNETGQHQLALKLAFRAIQANPRASIAYNNLGAAFGDLMMLSESAEAYKTAIAVDPKSIISLINLAQIQEKLENFEEAKRCYEEILDSKHASVEEIEIVKYYLSYSYLYFGMLEKGWEYYDLGFSPMLPPGSMRSLRRFNQPKWNGENISGKRILLWGEQGLGDELMFSTCLHDVLDLGASVVLECEPRLISMLKRTYPNLEVREPLVNVDRYSAINDFDFHCPLGSLPRFFRNSIEDFQRKEINIDPLGELVERYSERLIQYKETLLVGICWRSGLLAPNRNLHYASIMDWGDLFKLKNATFVNLQYGDCENEIQEAENAYGIKIIRWADTDLKNDLESVIALAKNLDCVVTVGTAVSVLAASVGTPTYTLIKRNWVLLGTDDKFPWFSSYFPIVAEKGAHVLDKFSIVRDIIINKINKKMLELPFN